MALLMGACPKCGSRFAVPQPVPEKLTCVTCHAVIKLALPGKSAAAAPAQAAPAAVAAKAASVQTVAGATIAGYEM